jgi:hypothetical protein
MLGERIGDATGKVTSQRVLPDPAGAPRMETSFEARGSLLGILTKDTGTYVTRLRPDGTLYGEGQGITMSAEGDAGTWVGQGVGTFNKDGSLSYRGAVYFQSASPKWSQLNRVAALFEYEVSAEGVTRSQLYEWK